MSVIRHIRFNNPAVGADVSETVPDGVAWKIRGWASHYTPDANVGNRFYLFRVARVPNGFASPETIYHLVVTVALVASTIKFISLSPEQSNPSIARWEATYSASICPLLLKAGDVISVTALNKKAGDFMDAVNIQVEEFKL